MTRECSRYNIVSCAEGSIVSCAEGSIVSRAEGSIVSRAEGSIVSCAEGSQSGDRHYIVNPLSGQADLLTKEESEALGSGRVPEGVDEAALAKSGYLVDAKEESSRYKAAYLDFLDEREQDEIQIFFVPTYACNFGCSYCYQAEYTSNELARDLEVVDGFFDYIKVKFAGRRKYLTLFGGEPLLPGDHHRAVIKRFLERANEQSLEVAVVTNGYHLASYLEMLSGARIREIQVTLDGPAKIHDGRRALKGGGKTFDRVVEGIDATIEKGIPVNLRMVIDRENASSLPKLARYAIDRGWTQFDGFKTQMGRNYELHACQAEQSRLYDRLEMAQMLFELLKDQPWIEEFIRPQFSIARQLADTQELPGPLFDSCPGCKTEWAFDMGGGIYSCTATVGKADEKLGTFWPEVSLDEDAVGQWEDRDVLSIEECRDCSVQLLCGGGCASIAKNKHGRLHAPDCRPIKELMDMGMALYVMPNEE